MCVMHTVYCKSFKVEKFRGCKTNCNSPENIHGWTVVWPKPIAQTVSWLPIDPQKPQTFSTSTICNTQYLSDLYTI